MAVVVQGQAQPSCTNAARDRGDKSSSGTQQDSWSVSDCADKLAHCSDKRKRECGKFTLLDITRNLARGYFKLVLTTADYHSRD